MGNNDKLIGHFQKSYQTYQCIAPNILKKLNPSLNIPNLILGSSLDVYPFFQIDRVLRTIEQMLDFLNHLQKKYPSNESTQKIVQNVSVTKILNFMNKNPLDIEDEKIVQFFEVYDLQFNKVKSLKLNKNAGGRYRNQFCCNCSIFQWKKRQFIITQNGIMYYKLKDGKKKVCEYISFNKYFSYKFGMQTGDQFGILIRSYHRRLKLKADNFRSFVEAIYFLEKAFNEHNQGRQNNRYGSFAAQRENNFVQFLVDGEEYFRAVAEEMSKAKHQIMIAGWWISPEFYLVRPIDPKHPERNRLSTILKSVTENNVKIYVLAYRESPYFLPNDSNYTKKALESISPNIKVITHPINIIPSLWSHHQKIVIIDQKVAFIGGLDLCYGRYDTSQHLITDKQNIYPGIEFNNSRIKDFCKVRDFQISNIMRSQHPRLPWHDVAIKLIGGSVNDVVKHFVEYWNFASYEALYQERIVLVPRSQKITNKFRYFVSEFKNKFLNPKEDQQNENKFKNIQSMTLDKPRKLQKKNQPQLQNQLRDKREWQNERKEKKLQFESDKSPRKRENRQNNETIKQMISQEIEEVPAEQINTANFLKTQRTNGIESGDEKEIYRYTSDENDGKNTQKSSIANEIVLEKQVSLPSPMEKLGLKKKIRKISVANLQQQQANYDSDNGDYLNEKQFDLENEQNIRRQGRFRQILRRIQSFDETIHKKTRKMTEPVQKSAKSKAEFQIQFKTDCCQVLRSVSKWSIGCKQSQSESSIHSAYLDMISNAQYFIYIENQFFMSATDGEKVLKNQIAKALIKRIERAINQKKKFRVIFLMPLIPGFAGELDDPEAILPRVILHWQYLTIFQSQTSVIKSLQKLTPNPDKYIQFYGLRTHDLINDEPKTQIVYLHTKLMIVDDKKAIIGSANINDRSMRGTRDSQIAVQIIGGDMTQSTVDDQPFMVSEKIKLLRMKLMRQHFGHTDCQGENLNFTDILNQKLFDSMEKIAKVNQLFLSKINTQTYRKLFGCYPDNMIESLKELKEFKRTPTKQEYLELSDKIKGHVVEFPYEFLRNENLLQGNSIYPNGITT